MSKAGMGMWLFRTVPESDFARSRTRTSFAGAHGKGLQRVCLFLSTFPERLPRCSRAKCPPLGPLCPLPVMVAWRSAFLICLAFSLDTLAQRERWNHVTTTTKSPGTTRAPAKPAVDDFDLADALDDRNDRNDGHRKPSAGGGGFSDKDLEDVLGGGGYQPDKGRGDGRYDTNDNSEAGMSPETGTIAGVASALAMALIGAVTSYISYQQKKFCFRIQQGLNADYVKGENLEAVVCEEPQVKYSEQPPQSAEPPQSQTPRI